MRPTSTTNFFAIGKYLLRIPNAAFLCNNCSLCVSRKVIIRVFIFFSFTKAIPLIRKFPFLLEPDRSDQKKFLIKNKNSYKSLSVKWRTNVRHWIYIATELREFLSAEPELYYFVFQIFSRSSLHKRAYLVSFSFFADDTKNTLLPNSWRNTAAVFFSLLFRGTEKQREGLSYAKEVTKELIMYRRLSITVYFTIALPSKQVSLLNCSTQSFHKEFMQWLVLHIFQKLCKCKPFNKFYRQAKLFWTTALFEYF